MKLHLDYWLKKRLRSELSVVESRESRLDFGADQTRGDKVGRVMMGRKEENKMKHRPVSLLLFSYIFCVYFVGFPS